MRLSLVSFLAWFFLLATPAAAAEVYAGTIGTAEVIVALGVPDQDGAGSYFYRRVGEDIPLQGDASGASFQLQERITVPAGEGDIASRTTGLWRLSRTPAGLTGDWRAGAGAPPRPVRLTRLPSMRPRPFSPSPTFQEYLVDTYGQPAGDPSAMMPYYLARARLPSTLGAEHRLGAGAWRLATDRATGVSWPRLTRLPDAAALARLNEVFEQNRAIAIAEAQACRASLIDQGQAQGRMHPRVDVADVRITRIGQRLISLTSGGSIFCGGAHPQNFYRAFTYDTATASLFDTSRLLDLSTPARQAAFVRYWRTRLAERMRREPEAVLAECEAIADPDSQSLELNYRLTPGGLMVVEVDQSGAGAACNQDLVELSLAQLAPFLAPGAAALWN